ncbi:histone-lysine N-methyltransferase SETMAR [Trichonephila clavipes]|nr:histone-lysine N-methyltransferase SETMAR [Trichonephila clavipes]
MYIRLGKVGWLEHRTPDRKAWVRCSMSPNTLRVHTDSLAEIVEVEIEVVSPSIVPSGKVSLSLNRTVTCMVLKANDRRTSCPCHDEFRGPRSDYVRQVALATTTTTTGEKASQVAEIVNFVYGADTVTANYVQFWFHGFRSGIFNFKVAPHTGRPVIESVDKITKIIEVDRYVSSQSIAQELKIDHKTVLSHLSKVGFKKKLDVWVPHLLTLKNMMDRVSFCEALAKQNEINSFFKRMVTGDEKWITYDNIVRRR